MPNTDPLSEVLNTLPSTSAPRAPATPYRTKKGVLKFQPDASDWSLDRLTEIESAFKTKFNKPLPVRNRGQGAIHNRLGYQHSDSADISLHPDTPEGQFVVSEFQRRNYPFLAFKGAIPGVSTGPHIHGGWPSKRTQRTQSPQFAASPQQPSSADDPLSQVLNELPSATPERRDPFAEVQAGVGASEGRSRIEVPSINKILTDARERNRPPARPIPQSPLAGVQAGVSGTRAQEGMAVGDLRRQEGRQARIDKEIRPKVVKDYFGMGAGGVRQDIPTEIAEQQIAADPRLRDYIEQETQRRAGQFEQREQRVSAVERGTAPELELADKIRNLRDKPEQLIPFLSSIPEFDDLLKAGESIEKLDRGETLSEEESLRLRELVAASKQDTSLGYKIANTVSGLPAFIGEFAYTGGVFTAGRKAALKGLEKIATKKGLEAIEKKLTARIVTKGITNLAGAAAQTIPAGATRIPVGVLQRQQEGDDFATALKDTMADQFIEIASERSGGLLSHIPLPKRLSAIRDAVTARWIAKKPGRTREMLNKIVTKSGWHGPLGEIFEERVGDVARYGAGLQASPIPSLEQLMVEGAAFSIPGVGLAAANKILSSGGSDGGDGGGGGGQSVRARKEPEQRFDHPDWGEVVKHSDQTGARNGKVKVHEAGNPEAIHFPRLVDLSPVKAAPLSEAQAPRDVPVEPETVRVEPKNPFRTRPETTSVERVEPKIYRSQEPDAGPLEFRGMDEGALLDMAAERQVPKGTSRKKRQEIEDERKAARAELQRRRTEETPVEIVPPDTGLQVEESDVPSFRDYVENRPEGGTRFETLEPGTADFERLAAEYVARYGSQQRAGRTQAAIGRQVVPERPETLQAQVGQLNAGQRDAVLFTPGETVLPHRRNFTRTQTEVGTFLHDPAKISADQIKAKVADGSYHELLGILEAKSPATTRTVTSRASDGTEIESAGVTPERENEQAQLYQDRAPEGGTIETGGPELAEQLIRERAASTTAIEDAIDDYLDETNQTIEEITAHADARQPTDVTGQTAEEIRLRLEDSGINVSVQDVEAALNKRRTVEFGEEIEARDPAAIAQAIFEAYDNTGELTEQDVVDELEANELLPDAVVAYRRAQEESREFGERMDITGETFEREVLPKLEALIAQGQRSKAQEAAEVIPETDPLTDILASLPEAPKEGEGLLLEPAEAQARTKEMLERDDPLNQKVIPLVTALNNAGVPTQQSGDLYGKNVVYVDLPGGKYTEGKLTKGVDTYERALKNAKLPQGWKVIRADSPASEAFEKGRPEKKYTGPRATATRLIRKGGAVTAAEAETVAEAVRDALSRSRARRVAAPSSPSAEVEPVKTPGQKQKIAGLNAEVIDAQRLDGIDYELYRAGDAGAIRIYDSDAGKAYAVNRYAKFSDAVRLYSEALEAAGGDVRGLRDMLPANLVKETPAAKKPTVRKELPQIEPLTVGRESKVVTERGSEVMTRYAIVDLDTLITSHDSALNRNPKFPQELQPRERDRIASMEQIDRIAKNLRPDHLAESPKASEGAPIIGPDALVESGNGRVLAIGLAYELKNDGSRAYRSYLHDNAERFGLDPAAVSDVKNPVLVRIRITEVDRPQFVKEANEQSIASMSSVEQARSDAKMLKGALLDLFRPSDSGEINTAGNINFVKAFMRDVVGPNEIGRYTTSSGQLSQEGVARIRNAIFARAYGESPEGLVALEKMAESPDNNVRNITAAMLRNAAGFASLREGIDQGTRYPLDLAPDIAAAMSKMSALREQGMPVGDYLRQGALYGQELTPTQELLLQTFDENKRGVNTINAILENYLLGANSAGNPSQAALFGGEAPSKASLLKAAILEEANARRPATSPSLFTTESEQRQAQPSARRNLSETNPQSESASPDTAASPTLAPQISELQKPPSEGEGRSVGRFDSAIDRLKAEEQEARKRLAERSAEFLKLRDEKGTELGASTIPHDLYDFVVIGASKLAQRSLNVAQFVDEMVREFGESVRQHIRTIFTLSQKMVVDTQKEIRAERLSKEIANRIFTDEVPVDQQRAALRIAAKFRTTTDTQGKFIAGFKSRVGEMAKSYGAAGGELTNRVHLGDIQRSHLMEEGNQYLRKIQDIYDKTKNDFERIRISESVIKALENRAQADRYLDTPEKKEVYANTKDLLDKFRKKLDVLGYETRDDYFTHIRDVDILDQIISDAKDPKERGLNELVAAESRFLKPRADARSEIKKNLPQVLFAYLKSVSKEVAYHDAVSYYYDHFADDIPISLRKNSMDRAIKLMQNSLKPEQGRGTIYRIASRLRSEQYRNFLAYNLKASAQNFTQVEFAKLRWTPEARSLVGKFWRNRKALTGPLADAINIASREQTPLMRFLEQFKGDEPSGSKGRFAEAFEKHDPFQRSEGRNWALAELGSIINSVVKHPDYRGLKTRLGAEGAINKLLEKQEVFDKAVREAATTSSETQVAANPAMRGEFYDLPLHRIISMFTAFKTRQMQILSEALRSHEGINGARAQTILRRGLSGDAQPVEVLREIETQRVAMERMLKKARQYNEDLGVSHSDIARMVDHLKTQERELNGIIKQIEPLSGGRAQSAALVAKYMTKVAAISVFFNVFWNSIYDAVFGSDDEKDAEERLSVALQKAFWDVLPSPFYGADPTKFFSGPVVPNFERSASFGHVTKRGLTKDVVSYGSSVIPFAGVIDRATNRRLSGAVVDTLVPKKEKKREIEF